MVDSELESSIEKNFKEEQEELWSEIGADRGGTVLGAHASRRRPHRKLVWLHYSVLWSEGGWNISLPKISAEYDLRSRELKFAANYEYEE